MRERYDPPPTSQTRSRQEVEHSGVDALVEEATTVPNARSNLDPGVSNT